MSDIYKPRHYTNNEIEVIQFIEQVTKDYPSDISYHVGNTLKYLARAPHKGNMEQDLSKALNYLNRAVSGEWYKEG